MLEHITYDCLFLKKKRKKEKGTGQMVVYLKAERLNMIQLVNPPTSGFPLI